MQFTRIAVSANSFASAFVNAITAALAAEYAARLGKPSFPAREPMLTMCPRPARRICGSTWRQTSNTPISLKDRVDNFYKEHPNIRKPFADLTLSLTHLTEFLVGYRAN
jgi:hypothetical protein